MNWITNIKKRNIAAVLVVGLRVFIAFKPEALTPDQVETIRWAIDSLLVVGAAHSVGRSVKTQKINKNE